MAVPAPVGQVLERLVSHLVLTGKSANTIPADSRDIRLFVEQFATTIGEDVMREVMTDLTTAWRKTALPELRV